MALLELVNDLRDLLRENQTSSVAGAGHDLRVQVGLVNRAARKVLARRPWSFLHREDGYLFFPARVEFTVAVIAQGASQATLLAGVSQAVMNSFSDGTLSSKILFPSGQTSYQIADLSVVFLFIVARLVTPYRGPSTSGSAILYSNEAALPETVGRILSIRNEEGTPIRFETVDTFDDFERAFPHDTERFGERPEVVAIGGQILPTSNNGFAVSPGLGIRFFPPPSSDVLLRYSYVRRPSALVLDTDVLSGVPMEIQDHIVKVAFHEALMANIEDDPQRGARLFAENESDYRELAYADRRDVGRRHVPSPFSSRRAVPWDRLLHERIPEP